MPTAPRRPRSRRQRVALWACLVWLLGVELGPNLHLALHDRLAAHDHGDGHEAAAQALVVQVHLGSHSHDGVVHHHDEQGAAEAGALRLAAGATTEDAVVPPPAPGRHHGAHSLAHRALAVPLAPAPRVVPLPIDRRPRVVAIEVAPLVALAPPPAASARAPPRG